jgi:O-antigen ligase
MTKLIFGLVVGLWISLHMSQSLMDLLDFLLVATAIWSALKNRDIKTWANSFKPSFLWPIWGGVVLLGFVFGAKADTKVSLIAIWEFRWILSFLSYVYLLKKIQWRESQIKVLSYLLLFISVIDIVMFFINYDTEPRAGGLFGHSMPFAHSIGPSALFLLFIGGKKAIDKNISITQRLAFIAGPVLATLLVVLTFTRGVWLGYVGALLICTAFLGRKVFIGTIGTLVIAGGLAFVSSTRIQNRILGKTNAETQSNDERLLYWKANFQIFKDYPIFGIGYSQNNNYVVDYLKKDGIEWLGGAHAHNQYIHFLAGTGALGLLSFLIFLSVLFYTVAKRIWTLKIERKMYEHFYFLLGIFAALMCFSIGALTESNFSIAKNRFLFLFIAAIGYALATNKEAQE